MVVVIRQRRINVAPDRLTDNKSSPANKRYILLRICIMEFEQEGIEVPNMFGHSTIDDIQYIKMVVYNL